MNNRQRGAIATVLDQSILAKHANGQAKSLGDDGSLLFQAGPGPQMLLDTEDGPAVINSEGVGHTLKDGTITTYLHYGMSLMPITLPLAAIESAKTSEKIDIADGIRTFGSRLDVNHHLWFDRTTQTS